MAINIPECCMDEQIEAGIARMDYLSELLEKVEEQIGFPAEDWNTVDPLVLMNTIIELDKASFAVPCSPFLPEKECTENHELYADKDGPCSVCGKPVNGNF